MTVGFTPYSLAGKRVFVAGHLGMAGRAISRRLVREDCEIVTVARDALDLRCQADVENWFSAVKPQAIFLAAGTVGGICSNMRRPAEFIYDNLAIQTNVIHAAFKHGTEKLLFLGSSCVYPREGQQPLSEAALLTGPLEPTNEAYAIAKIAGIKMCQAYRRQYGCDFISAMPTNLYGPGDRYDLAHGHVVAALVMKVYAAKKAGAPSIEIWGTGTPRREFLFTEDLADGLVFLMKNYSGESHLNLGTGVEMTIRELAEAIAKAAGWSGTFTYDQSKPDGMKRKVMDVSRLAALGWQAQTRFEDGIKAAYDWYAAHAAGVTA